MNYWITFGKILKKTFLIGFLFMPCNVKCGQEFWFLSKFISLMAR